MNYAVINSENLIVNVIVWDGVSEWSPPEGHTIAPLPEFDYGIGDSYINGEFIKAVEPT